MGLLRRIARPEGSSATMVDDIVEHLQLLLNTRRGDAPIDSDYGITDITDVSSASGLSELRRHLTQTIQRYEPRIEKVDARRAESNDPMVLRLDIRARLADDAGELRLRTDILPGGRVRVRRGRVT